MNYPSDKELLDAAKKLRPSYQHLGRLKLLSFLKEMHSWTLSEQRSKKCLDKNSFNAKTESEDLPRDETFNGIVKYAFIDFKKRERDVMLALSRTQAKVTNGYTSDSMYVARDMRHHVEVLLALKELKPCTLFTPHIPRHLHRHDRSVPEAGNQKVQARAIWLQSSADYSSDADDCVPRIPERMDLC